MFNVSLFCLNRKASYIRSGFDSLRCMSTERIKIIIKKFIKKKVYYILARLFALNYLTTHLFILIMYAMKKKKSV